MGAQNTVEKKGGEGVQALSLAALAFTGLCQVKCSKTQFKNNSQEAGK